MRRSRSIRLGLLAILIASLGVGRLAETRRLAVPLPRNLTATPERRLDAERMLLDLQVLASDRFQGRAPDTAGGALAAQLIATRFAELGLAHDGERFEQPFSFVHRSIRALWRGDRPFTKTFAHARNVIGYVPGTTRAGDVIVVSAHFDHLGIVNGQIHPGADDNASGTAALLALAAYMKGHAPAHTIVFAAFDAEELGLEGSQAFMDRLPFPRETMRLNINIDMIGRSDDGRLFVSGVRYSPALLPLVEAAARSSAVPVHVGHDRPIYLTGLIGDWTHASDHGTFHDAGIPFLYFGVEDHRDVHLPTDTADRIDGRFYAAAAEMILSTLVAADSE
jgi:Zn-dependent M28 family amino/carboxypeptidase